MKPVLDGGVRLEPPVLRRANLIRPRLLRQLRERFTTPVTVVVAAAGLGKTTLLAQAVAENRLAPLGTDFWLACCADDVAGSSLAEGLCQALGVTPPGSLDGAIDKVLETAWHHSPDEIALVIDDVHEIVEGSPGAEVLARLVEALPRNSHLVLSGRHPPPIALSRLEVEGHLIRIGESDLLFTDDELKEFAAARRVSADQLAGCGGWPAMAELAASTVPGIDAAYLWEEVLGDLRPTRRRALALLAHVGPVDDALASAVLGYDADVAELTANLPLVAATAAGGRQIHSLWRPHLARAVDAGDIAGARRRAGIELARAGDAATAVRLLAEAGAWDDVTDVVVDILGAAHPPIAGDVVAAWLGRLPNHLAGGALARLMSAVASVQTDPRAATRELQEAANAFRDEGNPAGELACMAQLGQLAWWSEHPDTIFGLASRLFEIEALGHDKATPLACLARALIADLQADCERVLRELAGIPPGSLHETLQSLVDWLRSTSLNQLGRLGEALEAAESACAHASPLLAPVMESTRLQALWFLGQIEEVLQEFPSIVERTEATGLRDYTSLMAAACCMAFASVGRADEASHYLEIARRSAASPGLPLVEVNLVIAEAATAIAHGDEMTAAQVFGEHLERSAPIGTGLSAFPQQRSLSLWYVLAPASRGSWDGAALGPCYAAGLELARAIVAIRTDGRLPAPSAPVPAPEVVRALLPLRWTTELALAQAADGNQNAWTLLEAVWPQAQAAVRHHADDADSPLARPARLALARLPVPPPSRLDLRLLGPVELTRDGVPVEAPEWRRERVRSLLVHLVLHRPAGRERLASDLWPSLDAEAQLRNLRVTLTHLRRALEPERGEHDASFLIRPHGNGLMLDRSEWFGTDLWRFDELWRRATEADRDGVPSAALGAMRQAVDLWRDDPSELAAHDWALPEVEERRVRLVNMATRAAELLLASDGLDEARRLAEVAVRCDPWFERAHRVVVAAHFAARHHRAARQALRRYAEMLAELGLDPAASARRLEPLTRGLVG